MIRVAAICAAVLAAVGLTIAIDAATVMFARWVAGH